MKYCTTQSQGRQEHPTCLKKRKVPWIGYIYRRNCLLEHVIEGLIEGRIEVTEKRGIRRRQLLYKLRETRGYWKMKEKAMHIWGARFERGYGPVGR
jgi:hypothetical protein